MSSYTVPSNSPIKTKAQAAQAKSGGAKKRVSLGGSKVKGASSVDDGSSLAGERQGQERPEGMMEKQLSDPSYIKVGGWGCLNLHNIIRGTYDV